MSAVQRLTDRQKACLRLVARGYTSKEIGRQLSISPATVDNHVRAALEVLQVDGRAEAARMLIEHETDQALTSQPPDLPERQFSADVVAIDPPPSPWWQRLVPPLGGTPNDLSRERKSYAILRVALAGMIVLVLLTLAAAFLLWAIR